MTQQTKTAVTVASQQYYHYPPGQVSVDAISITIGSVQYPLEPIYDQRLWNLFNSIQIQPTAIPQSFFNRRDDFGIWPIPQDVYTITLNAFNRDRNLLVADYATGTVTATQGSVTVTGSGTTFTPAMVGRWFTITDTTSYGQGYWYRVTAYVSATQISLEEAYQGTTGSGLTYNIGESPEIPEEGHVILIDGVTADFYFGMRDDTGTAQSFENKFWTGDRNNASRRIGDTDIAAGLIGLMNRYASRTKKRLIMKQPKPYLPQYKVFSTSIS